MSDLHVWSLKPGIPLLAAHLCLKEGADGEAALSAATSYCRSAGIECATLLPATTGVHDLGLLFRLLEGSVSISDLLAYITC